MEWIRRSIDASVVAVMFVCIFLVVIWANGKFEDLRTQIIVIKTVMVMNGIMPTELAGGIPETDERGK